MKKQKIEQSSSSLHIPNTLTQLSFSISITPILAHLSSNASQGSGLVESSASISLPEIQNSLIDPFLIFSMIW